MEQLRIIINFFQKIYSFTLSWPSVEGFCPLTASITYRVDQQCCPGGNCPETLRCGSPGGLRIFWLKSLANPEKIFKKIFFLHFFDNFVWICQWFSQKIRRPPAEGLRGVSGQFPPGQHCWSTRYVRNFEHNQWLWNKVFCRLHALALMQTISNSKIIKNIATKIS